MHNPQFETKESGLKTRPHLPKCVDMLSPKIYHVCIFLQSPSNEWQKFDYLLEFGQWLYHNEFPLQDSLEQFEWAVDILLNMRFEKEQKKDGR